MGRFIEFAGVALLVAGAILPAHACEPLDRDAPSVAGTTTKDAAGRAVALISMARFASSSTRAPIDRCSRSRSPRASEQSVWTPSLRLGRTVIDGVNAYIGDFHIFDFWDLQDEPTILIGMDVLARSREMAIDYGRGVVHFRKRPRGKM